MNIELLVKMANEISEFFAAESPPPQAAEDVAQHLRRFWEPRMRRQIIAYVRATSGAGLSELARRGIETLAAAEPEPA
ncbi:MAG: formate dehydrogenase subunit delta [Steroidobacteraceae bacterium]